MPPGRNRLDYYRHNGMGAVINESAVKRNEIFQSVIFDHANCNKIDQVGSRGLCSF